MGREHVECSARRHTTLMRKVKFKRGSCLLQLVIPQSQKTSTTLRSIARASSWAAACQSDNMAR
eukprot:2679732-Amphidinium_carterae.1